MLLPVHEFAQVIDRTPLVSLDLLVENGQGEFLLGLRTNRPAQGFWFVPGGRVRKGETLAQAFERLTLAELGQTFSLQDAAHQGLYEHFYSDNVFADAPAYEHMSTHYVVNAFKLKIGTDYVLPLKQHSAWRWRTPEQLLHDPQVHEHTKWYFQ